MYTAKVSAKGWIVIPKELRKRHGISTGSRVQVVEYGEILVIIPLPDDPVQALQGMLADGPSLTADLLAWRAEENKREIDHHAA